MGITSNMFKKSVSFLAVLVFTGWTGAASASFIDIDLSGWEAWGFFGDPSNTSTNIFLPVNTNIIGAEYINLEYEAFDPSWRSELTLSLNDSAAFVAGFWDIDIAGAPNSPGVFGPVSAPFAGGIGGPFTLSTGDLYIETYDTFQDNSDPDQRIYAGTLRVEYEYESVPEPATLAIFGLGLAGLGFARKKRKSA